MCIQLVRLHSYQLWNLYRNIPAPPTPFITLFGEISVRIMSSVSIGGSRGGAWGTHAPPWASKFFRFHAVFGKIWRVHAPPWRVHAPPSGKSWIRHWFPCFHLQRFYSRGTLLLCGQRTCTLLNWVVNLMKYFDHDYSSKSIPIHFLRFLVSKIKHV